MSGATRLQLAAPDRLPNDTQGGHQPFELQVSVVGAAIDDPLVAGDLIIRPAFSEPRENPRSPGGLAQTLKSPGCLSLSDGSCSLLWKSVMIAQFRKMEYLVCKSFGSSPQAVTEVGFSQKAIIRQGLFSMRCEPPLTEGGFRCYDLLMGKRSPHEATAEELRPIFLLGRIMSSLNSISSEKLWRLIGVPHGPALIDVRAKEGFAADPRFIPGAVRRAHATVSGWGSEFAGRPAVVICENGQGLSEGVAAWLRHAGASSAEILVGGHAAWAASRPAARPRKQTAAA